MKPKIYLDMDGTLVDFVLQVNKCGFWRKDNENKVDWKKVKAMGPRFWSEMDWVYGAEDAFHKLHEMEAQGLCELYILSSIDFEEGREGKKQWIKSHTIFPLEKVIFVQEPEDKANYAAPDAILIDDRNKSLKPFEKAGGYSINVNFGWGHGWETVLVKVKLLLSGLSFTDNKIIDTFEKDDNKYELTEKICDDDLQIVEIVNKTENTLDFKL